MMKKFSERIGVNNSMKSIQIDSIDEDLQNGLWNVLKMEILDPLPKYQNGKTEFERVCEMLWHHHFKWAVDTIPYSVHEKENSIRSYFFEAEWYEIYDLIEFFPRINSTTIDRQRNKYIEQINFVLEREFSGFRFIDMKLAPITNKNEVKAIEDAIINSSTNKKLGGVNEHLRSALSLISDKLNPDYRNSIKESISAVEAVAKSISGNPKDSLGGALDKIKGKIKMHGSLEKAFKSLYGYTSDSGGIRHAMIEDSTCEHEDALYMLVACSAFINYLLVKSNKNGIKL